MDARLPMCVLSSAGGAAGDDALCAPAAVPNDRAMAAVIHARRSRGASSGRLTDDRVFLEKGKCGMVVTLVGGSRLRIELQRQLQVRSLIAGKRDRIHPRIARGAVVRAAAAHGAGQPLEAQIGDAVG